MFCSSSCVRVLLRIILTQNNHHTVVYQKLCMCFWRFTPIHCQIEYICYIVVILLEERLFIFMIVEKLYIYVRTKDNVVHLDYVYCNI